MSSYLAVLRLPFAARTFGAALVGRLSYGTVFLSLTLALSASTGSLGRTGTVVAVFALVIAALAPVRARLIDRYGAVRILLPLSLTYAGALLTLAALTWRSGAPLGLLEAAAALAGATAPPLGPTMRTLWKTLADGDRALIQRAFSLDTVAEEVIGVSGPLLVGLVVLVARPAVGLVLSAALVAVGTAAMLTSPVVRTVAEASLSAGGADMTPAGWGSFAPIFEPVVVAVGTGLGLGAQNLAFVAFAVRHHQPSAIAWVEAGMSIGSIVGGVVYGAVSWRVPDRSRLPLLATALGLAIATAGLAPNAYVLTAVATVTGLFVSPLLTCAYLVADELAAPSARTSAGMWVNNAFNAGSSGGYASIGPVLARLPLGWCFAVAAVPVVAAAGAARAWRVR